MGLSTGQLRDAWAPPCNSAGFIRIDLYGSGSVTVDPRCVEAVVRLDDVLEAWNYPTRNADTGAYNCRQITGGSGYSLHAYGIALDINWQTNPYGPTLITDMPQGMVDDITALRTNNGKRVWEWGGSWSGNKDAMHYEIDCAPADLATGIAGPVIEPPPPPDEELGVPDMFVAIHEVALYAVVGGVLFTFRDINAYGKAKNDSPGVPVLAIGDQVSLQDRQDLSANLIAQHYSVVTR